MLLCCRFCSFPLKDNQIVYVCACVWSMLYSVNNPTLSIHSFYSLFSFHPQNWKTIQCIWKTPLQLLHHSFVVVFFILCIIFGTLALLFGPLLRTSHTSAIWFILQLISLLLGQNCDFELFHELIFLIFLTFCVSVAGLVATDPAGIIVTKHATDTRRVKRCVLFCATIKLHICTMGTR